MSDADRQNVCDRHPERIAAVERHGDFLCWRCSLGDEVFAHRFGDDWYDPPSPGLVAGGPAEKAKRRAAKKGKAARTIVNRQSPIVNEKGLFE